MLLYWLRRETYNVFYSKNFILLMGLIISNVQTHILMMQGVLTAQSLRNSWNSLCCVRLELPELMRCPHGLILLYPNKKINCGCRKIKKITDFCCNTINQRDALKLNAGPALTNAGNAWWTVYLTISTSTRWVLMRLYCTRCQLASCSSSVSRVVSVADVSVRYCTTWTTI